MLQKIQKVNNPCLDISFFRHGQSKMNLNPHIISGRSNQTPLSTKGEEEAVLLGKRIRDSGIVYKRIYSSTAKRAIDTGIIAMQQSNYNIDKIVQSAELLELDQGDWEGKLREETYTTEIFEKIRSDNWNFAAPNGESQRDVEERMLGWINKNLVEKYEQNLTVGIFTHGFAIKCFLRGIMNSDPKMTYKIQIDNTSITRVNYSNQGWKLLTVNDSSHLKYT
jgi:broad specificity phosphatase PhoE